MSPIPNASRLSTKLDTDQENTPCKVSGPSIKQSYRFSLITQERKRGLKYHPYERLSRLERFPAVQGNPKARVATHATPKECNSDNITFSASVQAPPTVTMSSTPYPLPVFAQGYIAENGLSLPLPPPPLVNQKDLDGLIAFDNVESEQLDFGPVTIENVSKRVERVLTNEDENNRGPLKVSRPLSAQLSYNSLNICVKNRQRAIADQLPTDEKHNCDISAPSSYSHLPASTLLDSGLLSLLINFKSLLEMPVKLVFDGVLLPTLRQLQLESDSSAGLPVKLESTDFSVKHETDDPEFVPSHRSEAKSHARQRSRSVHHSPKSPERERLNDEVFYKLEDTKVTVKVESKALVLNPGARELKPDFPITLDRNVASVTVSRDFLSYKYGGSQQGTFPGVRAEKKREHNLNDFMFLHHDYNPNAPRFPGQSGYYCTIFDGGPNDPKPTSWHRSSRMLVFTRTEPNHWRMVGTYAIRPTHAMTTEEWRAQSLRVQKTWVNNLCVAAWGDMTRARIALRKRLGREPTMNEVEEALVIEKVRVKLLNNGGNGRRDRVVAFEVRPEEMQIALDKGEACLIIYAMECVDYSVELQREIAREGPGFNRAPEEEEKPNPEKKRKHVELEVESEEESEAEELVYRARPSKSRSRVVS